MKSKKKNTQNKINQTRAISKYQILNIINFWIDSTVKNNNP